MPSRAESTSPQLDLPVTEQNILEHLNTEHEPQSADFREEVRQIFSWLHSPVLHASDHFELKEGQYLHEHILPRIRVYKEIFQQSVNEKTIERTWRHRNTLFSSYHSKNFKMQY